jgi:predicted ATP-dependent endonuclease of OLD family
MIKSLDINNFTVFPQASFTLSPQLNVLVGENGSGKSHLLKVIYSVLAVSAEEGRKPNTSLPTKSMLQTRLAEKLIAVLRPETLGRLARRKQGHERCELRYQFDNPDLDLDFSFATQSKSEVEIEKLPILWLEKAPVFLPTRELLTIYPGFVSVYENHYLEFEENWRDTCLLLGALALRGAKEKRVKELLAPLEEAMGGKVELDKNGRFYLTIPGQGQMEMQLVAEGLRKLAMLARLIATGSLMDKGYLFWDEPESNLNPRLIKQVARSILSLALNDIQLFIATHSLFLLRELDILLQAPEFQSIPACFFGLHLTEDGVDVKQGNTVEDIGQITALEEELSQSNRYLDLG